jgi:superfamily II DNA or RNA helicase
MPKLSPGLYDLLVSRDLQGALAELDASLREVVDLAPDHAHATISRAIQPRLFEALRAIKGDDRVERQVALANRVLELLASAAESGTEPGDALPLPARKLLAILEPVAPPASPRAPQRPTIPLAASDLLVNARHDLSLGPQLCLEIPSADRIDLLCAFVKWPGLRIVEAALAARLAQRPGSVRVLTTTYLGSTDKRALDRLVEMGARVKVSYDTGRTRLHAKAWLFHRASGFSTAFIGSSNLTATAVLEGLEWNVRLAQVDNAAILEKFAVAFEQYWQDPDFRDYDPVAFAQAVQGETRLRAAPYLIFDLEPKPHQRRILEELEAERNYGHLKNLVVAATGTGKTVIAALDYRRLRDQLERTNLLFVAHRREILRQSRDTFRVVLRDGAFGEMLGDGVVPDNWTHVFANIQSLSPERLEAIPADRFDVVIVDEFHHAAAASYDRLLDHIRPRILLGLTATPERTDGQSILHWFDGRIAAEIRLWEALDQSLLSPFQYFGIGGAPNASGIRWSRGAYDRSQLSGLYTADHMFALRVLQETQAKVADITRMRALGFCVDLEHARFMTDRFNERGIKARMVSGESKATERDDALRALAAREVQVLFTVDLFNEGVDVPEVDTILFLRPTESATVFLQQLGRGLRLSRDKACCTVLDFIGDAHRKFRFDARYRAVVGGTRRELERRIENGFPSLPAGCFIHLDAQAQDAVLRNVRAALAAGRTGLIDDLRELAKEGPPTLHGFLQRAEVELEDVYAGDFGWTALRRKAGLEVGEAEPTDAALQRSFVRMLHLDDDRIERFEDLLAGDHPPTADADDPYQRMLFVLTGNIRRPYDEMCDVWAQLWRRGVLRDELRQLLAVLKDERRHVAHKLPGAFAELALRVHGTYTRDEVFAAFDERSKKNQVKRTQGGIYDVKAWKTELLFVELEKSATDYSPTTLYNDHPITPELFRWESQSSAHEGTPAGRRYLAAVPGGDQNVLLFVRQRRSDARGETMPYLCLGLCALQDHRGAKPMRIDWRLTMPMPAWFFEETKIAGG